MKARQVFALLVVSTVLTFLAGCGSVGTSAANQPTPTPVSSSPTPTPTPTASSSRFVYGIAVFESDTGYHGASINGSTGQLTPIAPFNDSGLGQNIVIQVIADPKGRFLYSLTLGTGHAGVVNNNWGIAELQINSQTGALSRIAGGPIVFPTARDGFLAIEPSGHFLYQADAGVFDIYAIDQNSGLLTQMASSTAPSLGNFIAVSSDGRLLFNSDNTNVETLSIDASGKLSVVQSPVPTGGSADDITGQLLVSPDNKFLYVLNQGSVAIFNIGASGTLTPVVCSPFTTDPRGNSMSITPDGKHLYVTFDGATRYATGFTYDPVASTLTPIPNGLVNNATTVTIDASGKFAFVADAAKVAFVTNSIDPATGVFIPISQTTEPLGSQSSLSITVVP